MDSKDCVCSKHKDIKLTLQPVDGHWSSNDFNEGEVPHKFLTLMTCDSKAIKNSCNFSVNVNACDCFQ